MKVVGGLQVRILFYADSSESNLLPVPFGEVIRGTVYEFGLSILKDILVSASWPSISVTLVNRFWDINQDGSISPNAVRKTTPDQLTEAMLQKYDEVWFFGKHLGSFQPGDLKTFNEDINGYPDSALTPSELSALADWMNKGGGVLILGDHSNHPTYSQSSGVSTPPLVIDPNDGDPIDETDELYNLGRAMGESILRAGQMRVWQGPPGGYAPTDVINNPNMDPLVNTSGDTDDMTWMPKQENGNPQTIYPLSWPIKGNRRAYHPLFIGSPRNDDPNGIIRVFPDHGHEGALNMLINFDESSWPTATHPSYQPRPVVVASGTNQDTNETVDLVSAYDGHPAGVGRIVAHTSFHHYVNVNIHAFRPPTGSPPSETFQIISEYFANVAAYLMPNPLRTMAMMMLLQSLAKSSNIRDLAGAPFDLLGRAAYKQIKTIATGGQIQDLVNLAVETVIPPTKDNGTLQLPIPTTAYLLGGLVAEFQAAHSSTPQPPGDSLKHACMSLGRGIKRALQTRTEELKEEVEAIKALL